MKIYIAKTAGFCMGVRRAVEMVLDAPNNHKEPINTYGPLIHNPQVLELLEEKEIQILNRIPEKGEGTVLVRAHGVPPQAQIDLKNAGCNVIDATCPRVIKVQTIIRKHAQKGFAVIILGDRGHPEVIGLLGYAGDKGHVVAAMAELEKLPAFKNAIAVAQTTLNTVFFQDVKQWIARNHHHYKVSDTICDSTHRRQEEVKRLAQIVDAIVVVGGRNSGNTQRLVEVGRQSGKPTYPIETEAELEALPLDNISSVAITAGASTPNWVINRVFRTLEKIPLKKGLTWRRAVFASQRALLLTNVYLAMGAAGLCYTSAELLNIRPVKPYVLIAMAYVFSMHILNNFLGTKADRYNDPGRAFFYEKYKILLVLLALLAGGYGLVTAAAIGTKPFMVLLIMSLLGLSYTSRLFPRGLMDREVRRIRDIPGSKTILIALAWGMVVTVLPALSNLGELHLSALVTFLWVSGLVFVRTAFFDILDIQGDRILGHNTIPLVFGQEKTLKFLKITLAVMIATLILAAAFRIAPSLTVALTICPLFLWLIIAAFEKGLIFPGFRLEFLVESQFILAGAVTLVYMTLVG